MSEKNVEGGCFCGGIRYQLTADPVFVHACHCRDCQIQTGGPFAVNGIIERDAITLLKGQPEPVSMHTESGQGHDIYRCPDCQTAIWSDYSRTGYRAFVRLMTLDDPDTFRPDVHIYTRTKLPWIVLPDGVPTFEAYYDVKALWPDNSLNRMRAARNRAMGR